jgi:hypothetical protein
MLKIVLEVTVLLGQVGSDIKTTWLFTAAS